MSTRARVLALVLAIVAVVALRITGHERRQNAAVAATQPPATASPGPSASPSPSGAATPVVVESGPHDDMEPAAAAETWVRTWLNTAGGKDAWLARLTPITDADLLSGLQQTDITLVPGGGKAKVLPGTRLAPVAGQADVTARVLTTSGAFDVTLTIRAETWIVTSNDQARV